MSKPTREVPHDCLYWIGCYDDSCLRHKSGKEGSRYYPREPKKKKGKQRIFQPSRKKPVAIPIGRGVSFGFPIHSKTLLEQI